jgi:hypothetical protein
MKIILMTFLWAGQTTIVSLALIWFWAASQNIELAMTVVMLVGLKTLILSLIVCFVALLILEDCVRYNRKGKIK